VALLLLLVVSLALLWVGSGIAMHKGLHVFAAGLCLLAIALARYRAGSRQLLYRACFGMLLGASSLLAIESLLRLFPGLLRGRVANYTWSGYHEERGGIYRRHPTLGREMKPHQRRAMYWNGHWWTHETNADGYRGRAVVAADAVFLGDSLVYGHGVEAEQTVPAQFRRDTGQSVANLGQQGIGPIQSLVLFRDKGVRLRPRSVYVCLHPGDVRDALDLYEPAALRQFLAEPRQPPLVRRELLEEPPWSVADWWSEHVAPPLRLARVLSALRGKRDWMLQSPAPGGDGVAYVPAPAERVAAYPAALANGPEELRLAWRANRQALAEIRRLSESWGGRVILFDLGYPRAFSEAVEALARELGAGYSPAGRVVLSRALAGEPMYLANDGHWTAAGCQAIAQILAAPAR
jgi:hypothetical protein